MKAMVGSNNVDGRDVPNGEAWALDRLAWDTRTIATIAAPARISKFLDVCILLCFRLLDNSYGLT